MNFTTAVDHISVIAYTESVEIRFSCQARNKLRLYKLTPQDVEEAINSGNRSRQGNKWQSHYQNLRVIWVMVASYALVITVIKTK